MVKNKQAFTIIEALIALIILSLLVSSFYKLLQEVPNLKTYKQIQAEENQYYKK